MACRLPVGRGGCLAAAAVLLVTACSTSGSQGPSAGGDHSSSVSSSSKPAATKRPAGGIQSGVFQGAHGAEKPRCVRVDKHMDREEHPDAVDLRSGGLVAGDFRAAQQDFANTYAKEGGSSVKIYWIPLHAGQMETLTVRATRTTGKKITRTMRKSDVAWSDGGSLFYPSGVPIPKPGTWKLEATAGPDKGCFIVNFSKE